MTKIVVLQIKLSEQDHKRAVRAKGKLTWNQWVMLKAEETLQNKNKNGGCTK